MSKLLNDCICLFYFQVGWGGVVWGWLYFINSLQKKTYNHPAVLLNSFKFCAPVVFVWFWLFLSCLRRRRAAVQERIRYYNFFPKHSFLFLYYHKMNLLYSFIISKILVYIFKKKNWQTLEIQSKKVVTQIGLHFWHFLQHISMNIFAGKRYFNDILWAPAYNNITLSDTGISSNKI